MSEVSCPILMVGDPSDRSAHRLQLERTASIEPEEGRHPFGAAEAPAGYALRRLEPRALRRARHTEVSPYASSRYLVLPRASPPIWRSRCGWVWDLTSGSTRSARCLRRYWRRASGASPAPILARDSADRPARPHRLPHP